MQLLILLLVQLSETPHSFIQMSKKGKNKEELGWGQGAQSHKTRKNHSSTNATEFFRVQNTTKLQNHDSQDHKICSSSSFMSIDFEYPCGIIYINK